jgi:hypothetical protein
MQSIHTHQFCMTKNIEFLVSYLFEAKSKEQLTLEEYSSL